VKPYPFKEFPSVPSFMIREHADMFFAIRAEVARRVASVEDVHDGRHGFGTVHAQGRSLPCLGTWKWRHADPEDYPCWLSADMFVDDPVGLLPGTSFTARCIVAEEFASVANAAFESKGVRFRAHPLQVVPAGPDRPAGIRRGQDADELAVELHIGVPTRTIIDEFVRAEFNWNLPDGGVSQADEFFQLRVWHRAERVNAARTVLGIGQPDIRVPGLPALRRRVRLIEDARAQNGGAAAA
jgi:hypothetical protein